MTIWLLLFLHDTVTFLTSVLSLFLGIVVAVADANDQLSRRFVAAAACLFFEAGARYIDAVGRRPLDEIVALASDLSLSGQPEHRCLTAARSYWRVVVVVMSRLFAVIAASITLVYSASGSIVSALLIVIIIVQVAATIEVLRRHYYLTYFASEYVAELVDYANTFSDGLVFRELANSDTLAMWRHPGNYRDGIMIYRDGFDAFAYRPGRVADVHEMWNYPYARTGIIHHSHLPAAPLVRAPP